MVLDFDLTQAAIISVGTFFVGTLPLWFGRWRSIVKSHDAEVARQTEFQTNIENRFKELFTKFDVIAGRMDGFEAWRKQHEGECSREHQQIINKIDELRHEESNSRANMHEKITHISEVTSEISGFLKGIELESIKTVKQPNVRGN